MMTIKATKEALKSVPRITKNVRVADIELVGSYTEVLETIGCCQESHPEAFFGYDPASYRDDLCLLEEITEDDASYQKRLDAFMDREKTQKQKKEEKELKELARLQKKYCKETL